MHDQNASMADFLTNLWTSVFTPGPTPTLLIATNVTFAALQVTLFALLIATYSIHFLILSVLCAGLWGSINWFARELLVAQEQVEAEKKREARRAGKEGADAGEESEATGTETEVEDGRTVRRSMRVRAKRTPSREVAAVASGKDTEGGSDLKVRGGRDLSGEVSTDSEWEKVEGDR